MLDIATCLDEALAFGVSCSFEDIGVSNLERRFIMPTLLSFSRDAHAHSRRFLSHLATFAEPPTPELIQLWTMLDRSDLSEARSRVADLVTSLIENAELQASDLRLLLGFSYLRLQYLLGVQAAGKAIDALLCDPERMQARLTKAFAAIEPDLLGALTPASRDALKDPAMREQVASGFRHLTSLSRTTVKFDEAARLPAYRLPDELHEPSSTTLALTTLIVVNLWPNKTNTPEPKVPSGGGGDGGAPKPK